jgi:hypothetical protein
VTDRQRRRHLPGQITATSQRAHPLPGLGVEALLAHALDGAADERAGGVDLRGRHVDRSAVGELEVVDERRGDVEPLAAADVRVDLQLEVERVRLVLAVL